MNARWKRLLVSATILVVCGIAPSLPFWDSQGGRQRVVHMTARQYAFDPPVIRARLGDVLRIRLKTLDIVHGFYLEGYDVNLRVRPNTEKMELSRPSRQDLEPERIEELVIVANRAGKFNYRCSFVCGTMHPLMVGRLIVGPNRLLRSGIGLTIGMLLAMLWWWRWGGHRSPREPRRTDLFAKWPWLKRAIRWGGFRFAVMAPGVFCIYLFILAGLFGTPLGNRNLAIMAVWVAWWPLLMVLMVPLGGRIWCTICPLPFLGDWLQRRSFTDVRPGRTGPLRNRLSGLNRRWPGKLRNIWPSNVAFMLLGTFSVMLMTRPKSTAWLLLGLILLPAVLALIFRLRSFCKHICPVGGFLHLYSMTARTELRHVRADQCKACRTNDCIIGNERGWACPWSVYMGKLDRNNTCGLCMECVRSCPHDNISLFWRPFGSDTQIKGYDEAWRAFIMLALVIVYHVAFFGPWARIQDWAGAAETGLWAGFGVYAVVVWCFALLVVPGLFALAVASGLRLSRASQPSLREALPVYSYTAIPLGLFAWIAFSMPLLPVDWSDIIATLSDPLGWGWNLFGTADLQWAPFFPHIVPYLQIPAVMIGLFYALRAGHRLSEERIGEGGRALRAMIPPGALLSGFAAVFVWLFAG